MFSSLFLLIGGGLSQYSYKNCKSRLDRLRSAKSVDDRDLNGVGFVYDYLKCADGISLMHNETPCLTKHVISHDIYSKGEIQIIGTKEDVEKLPSNYRKFCNKRTLRSYGELVSVGKVFHAPWYNKSNLLPIIHKQFATMVSKNFEHALNSSPNFSLELDRGVKMQCERLLGVENKTYIVPADNSAYLVLGRFNDKFIIDDDLEVHKNKGLSELKDQARFDAECALVIRNIIIGVGTIGVIGESIMCMMASSSIYR
jgi:hypothetical protein